MKDDAVLLVDAAHEVAELGSEDALERPALGRHHVHLDLAGAQRGRDLEADEARADHHGALGLLGVGDDGARIRQRAQHVHVRLAGARDVEAHGLGAGREHSHVERQRLSVGKLDLLHLGIDRGHLGAKS